MRRWFLSYNSADFQLAASLEARLRAIPGSDVFFAPWSLRASGYWLPKLADAIGGADAFILLIGEHGLGRWQVAEYYEALDKRAKEQAFPVILVLLEGHAAPGLPFLRQLHWIVTADPTSEETMGKLGDATAGDGAPPGELWRFTAPYRGLAAMTEADSEFFFGREVETAAVLQAMAHWPHRLAVLIGNSGVGKSSLVQAGVIGALKRESWPDTSGTKTTWPHPFQHSRRWCFLSLKPGAEPLRMLVQTFLDSWQLDATDPDRVRKQAGWVSALASGESTLRDLLDTTIRRYSEVDQPSPPAFFLHVDQGEELYARSTLSQRARFSEVIAAGVADPRLTVLMSLRADFFGELQNDAPLFSVHHQINLAPLDEAKLLATISRPAEVLSAHFESDQIPLGLARHTAEEAVKDTDALPLLSYLLDDMWTAMVRRGDGVLRLPAQAMELGRVLADRANAFVTGHPHSEDRLRQLFTLKLATVREDGEPTPRRALRSEFSDDEWRLVVELAGHPNRLLVTATPEGHETYAEVAHEAIFRRWDRLREWIVSEREFLSWRKTLEAHRRQWAAAPESTRTDALLIGLSLAQAQGWLVSRADDLSRPDREFIDVSLQHDATLREEPEPELAERKPELAAPEPEPDRGDRLDRRLLLGAAAVLVLLLGLAGFAGYQWIETDRAARVADLARAEADRERARAERNFAAAKLAVGGLVSDITDGLGDVAGMRIETVREILGTVRKTIDALAETAPEDLDLQRGRAAMFALFADTYLSAGSLADAGNAADQCAVVARRLAELEPGNARVQRDLSICLERIGTVKHQAGYRAGAFAAFEASLAIRRRLAEQDPGAQAQRDLSVSLEKIGEAKRIAGDSAGTLAAFEESLAIRRRLAGEEPGSAQAHLDLSSGFQKLGDVKFRAGDQAGAFSAFEEGLAIARRLEKDDPDSALAQRNLSFSLDWIGEGKHHSGDPAGALNAFEESLAVRRRLASQDPDNGRLERDLSLSLNNIGDVKQQVGDWAGAFAAYEESLAIARRLADREPENTLAQRDLSVSLERIGNVNLQFGDQLSALAAFEESLATARRVAEQDAGNVQAETDLVTALKKMASVSNDPAPLYREALAILHRLDTEGRLSADQKGWIGLVEGKLAALPPMAGR